LNRNRSNAEDGSQGSNALITEQSM